MNVNSITLGKCKHTWCINLAAKTFNVNLFHTLLSPVLGLFSSETLVPIYERHVVGGVSLQQSVLAVLSFWQKHTFRCRSTDCPKGSLFFFLPPNTLSFCANTHLHRQSTSCCKLFLLQVLKKRERHLSAMLKHLLLDSCRASKWNPCGVGESVGLGKVSWVGRHRGTNITLLPVAGMLDHWHLGT